MSHTEGRLTLLPQRCIECRQKSSNNYASCWRKKTLSLTATNRIHLRDPWVQLYRGIETFQFRAVTDEHDTID